MDGIRQMGRGIAPEITYASCLAIHPVYDEIRTFLSPFGGMSPEMPVLTKKAVERAGMKKDCLIFVAVFCLFGMGIIGTAATCSPWTDPIPHAVCRERVVVPGKIPFVGSPADELCPHIPTCPAKTHFLWRYPASIDAKLA
jgi:hypothetical protein